MIASSMASFLSMSEDFEDRKGHAIELIERRLWRRLWFNRGRACESNERERERETVDCCLFIIM